MLLNNAHEKRAFLGAARAALSSVPKGTITSYLKGVPKEMGSQALGFGAFGGGLEAAMAEKGQRMEALKRGIGSGALIGLGFGAGTGLIRAPAMALRRKSLQNIAKGQRRRTTLKQNEQAMKELPEKVLSRGWTGNIKDIATGKGALGRRGAASGAAGGTAQLVGEWGLPMTALPAAFGGMLYGNETANLQKQMAAGHPYPQHIPKTAEDILGTPPEVIGGVLGGTGANLLARIPLQYLSKKYNIPASVAGTIATEAIPTAASVGGFLGGRRKAQELFPKREPKEPEELEKLKMINFDKLLRYYKRPEATV